MGHGIQNRPFGNLMEHHSLDRLIGQQIALPKNFIQMPGNGLPFAIWISRQIERLGLGGCFGDGIDMTLVLVDQLILHREIVRGVNGSFLGDQIAHMAVRGQNLEILAQIFFDCFRLGRRFDDNQIFTHNLGVGNWDGRAPTRSNPPARRKFRRGKNDARCYRVGTC